MSFYKKLSVTKTQSRYRVIRKCIAMVNETFRNLSIFFFSRGRLHNLISPSFFCFSFAFYFVLFLFSIWFLVFFFFFFFFFFFSVYLNDLKGFHSVNISRFWTPQHDSICCQHLKSHRQEEVPLAQSVEHSPRNHKVPGLILALANSAYE